MENKDHVVDVTESNCPKCLIEQTESKSALSDGLWRKPEEPPEDNREVVLLTSFDVYIVRYIDGEWNMPGRYDEQINEEILGWADKP